MNVFISYKLLFVFIIFLIWKVANYQNRQRNSMENKQDLIERRFVFSRECCPSLYTVIAEGTKKATILKRKEKNHKYSCPHAFY